MKTNKREVEGIDESFLLSSIKEQEQPKETVIQTQQEKIPQEPEQEIEEIAEPVTDKSKEQKDFAKRKRNPNANYSSTFLKKNELKTRQCVYISTRIHATISEIVRVIADGDVTVGGYIDNVLFQHLEANKEAINELYKRDKNDLI
jgi:hypothetical protein